MFNVIILHPRPIWTLFCILVLGCPLGLLTLFVFFFKFDLYAYIELLRKFFGQQFLLYKRSWYESKYPDLPWLRMGVYKRNITSLTALQYIYTSNRERELRPRACCCSGPTIKWGYTSFIDNTSLLALHLVVRLLDSHKPLRNLNALILDLICSLAHRDICIKQVKKEWKLQKKSFWNGIQCLWAAVTWSKSMLTFYLHFYFT